MPRKISEERTRKELIDPQLEHAGWYLRAFFLLLTRQVLDMHSLPDYKNEVVCIGIMQGGMSKTEGQVNGMFESLLAEAFSA